MKPLPLVLLNCAWLPLAAAESPAKPNILFIVGDDMGYADVGCHGCKDIPTPHIDALAAAGVRFTHGYVTGPYCSPTRAALLTGRYQTRFGHEFNPEGTNGLPLTETTLAARLKAAGYTTGAVGKWHLGARPEMHPQKRGFDEFYGFLAGAHSYTDSRGILRGDQQADDIAYATDAFGDEALAFIDRHRGRPWFLYLAFNAVHTPMEADAERLARFAAIDDPKRRTYAAMMVAMDDAIGKVRAKLKQAGMESNTLVLFISDNGGPTMPGTTVNASRNDPFRGSKRTTLEGGIRVPFIISWPQHLKPGQYHQPVSQLDATATAIAAAGVVPKPAWQLDGVDLLPYLTNPAAGVPHDALYWRLGAQMAIRHGNYKLVRYDLNVDSPGPRKSPGVSAAKLYDLAKDPGETHDLAAEMPAKAKELQAKWDAWNARNSNPLWGGRRVKDER